MFRFIIKRSILTKKLQFIKCREKSTVTKDIKPISMARKVYGDPNNQEPPPVVMVHGLLGCAQIWHSQCKALHENTSPQRTIIAVDTRNHGDSPHTKEHSYLHIAEDIKYMLLGMNIQEASFVGHSMGGRAIMYFALKYPDMVEKLIIGDISPVSECKTFKSMQTNFEAMQKVVMPKTNDPHSLAANFNVDDQLFKILKDSPLCMFLITNLTEHNGTYKWKANVPALAENFHENILQFPNVESKLKCKKPTLFLISTTSQFVPDADRPKIRKIFPFAEFTKIIGAGHWIHTQKPYVFNKRCVEFLNRQFP